VRAHDVHNRRLDLEPRRQRLVLANGIDTLNVAANANSFTMPTAETSGSTYNVTVATQPSNQLCQIANGSNTVGTADVTNSR